MMSQAPYSLRNFNILLVEDYEFIKDLIVAMLRAFGVSNITVAANAREAIETLTVMMTQTQNNDTAKPIDIVLTDWMMPGGPGSELIQWMRNHKNETIRFLPVIMLSTFAHENAVIAARDMGANEVLVKPVSAEKVATRILSIIDHPRPFVKTTSFFGPDRRRRDREWKKEERRKTDASQIVEHKES